MTYIPTKKKKDTNDRGIFQTTSLTGGPRKVKKRNLKIEKTRKNPQIERTKEF
jgi:hypothetical protein